MNDKPILAGEPDGLPREGRNLWRFLPSPADRGKRLDQYVPAAAGDLSRTLFRRLVDLGGVHVGGRRVRRCDHPVQAGVPIEVHLDGGPLDIFSLSKEMVLFQDEFFIALNKPAGVETQPTPARFKGTVYEALRRYLQQALPAGREVELGMVQRLDRDTSGVMVFSTHRRAHRRMSQVFAERLAEKYYLALVQGAPPAAEGEFRSLLARGRKTNLMHSVDHGGKEAVTRYRVLERFAAATLAEVRILTGRSHQIRVHFAEAGCPLWGDRKYGGPLAWEGGKVRRLMLHAVRLRFPHPITGALLSLEAPPPRELLEILELLRRQGQNPQEASSPKPGA